MKTHLKEKTSGKTLCGLRHKRQMSYTYDQEMITCNLCKTILRERKEK